MPRLQDCTRRWPSTSGLLDTAPSLGIIRRTLHCASPWHIASSHRGPTTRRLRKRQTLGQKSAPSGPENGDAQPSQHRPGRAERATARATLRNAAPPALDQSQLPGVPRRVPHKYPSAGMTPGMRRTHSSPTRAQWPMRVALAFATCLLASSLGGAMAAAEAKKLPSCGEATISAWRKRDPCRIKHETHADADACPCAHASMPARSPLMCVFAARATPIPPQALAP